MADIDVTLPATISLLAILRQIRWVGVALLALASSCLAMKLIEI